MPQLWNLKNRVFGRELGSDLFQFRFESEADLQAVLRKAPYHYKLWMLILQCWEPVISASFPTTIPFWIKIHKLPALLWDDQTVRTIGSEVGPVLDQDSANGRVRVAINGMLHLEMKVPTRLPSGEITMVELEYEKLEKHCFHCFSLSHEKKECPKFRPSDRQAKGDLGISQHNTLSKLEDNKRNLDHKKEQRDFPPPPNRKPLSNRGRDPDRPSEYRSRYPSDHRQRTRASRSPPRRSYKPRSLEPSRHSSHSRRPNAGSDRRNVGIHREQEKESRSSHLSSYRERDSAHRPLLRNSPTRPTREDSRYSHQGSGFHTPPPNPPREAMTLTLPAPLDKGKGIATASPEVRKSTLERISQPSFRDHQHQLRGRNSGSSRLQDITIHYAQDEDLVNPFGSYPRQSAFLPREGQTSQIRDIPISQTKLCPDTLTTTDAHMPRIPASLRLGPIASLKGTSKKEKKRQRAYLRKLPQQKLKLKQALQRMLPEEKLAKPLPKEQKGLHRLLAPASTNAALLESAILQESAYVLRTSNQMKNYLVLRIQQTQLQPQLRREACSQL